MMSRRSFVVGAGASATLLATGCEAGRRSPSKSSDTTTPRPSTTAAPNEAPSPAAEETADVPNVSADPVPVTSPWADADFGRLDRFLDETHTNAFRIVERGELIHEWYRTDETFVRDIASAQKSVLSLLVGRAIGDGLIGLDTAVDDVLGAGWTPHGRTAAITVRQLLSMTSGLDDQLAVIAPPGSEWHYSNAFAVLFDVLIAVTGRDLNDIADAWLFGPAGASTAEFYERRTKVGAPIGLLARASDLTAVGQTVLDASQPGLPVGWLDESFQPSQPINEAYGLLWWLNGQASFLLPGARVTRPGELIPAAPDDVVAALGKDDQKMYVSRDLDLVVARLGDKASGDVRPALSTFDDPLWELLVDLRSG